MKYTFKSLLIAAVLTTPAAFATVDDFLATETNALPAVDVITERLMPLNSMSIPEEMLATAEGLRTLLMPDFDRLIAVCNTPETTPEDALTARLSLKALQVHGLERIAALYEACATDPGAAEENIQIAKSGARDLDVYREMAAAATREAY